MSYVTYARKEITRSCLQHQGRRKRSYIISRINTRQPTDNQRYDATQENDRKIETKLKSASIKGSASAQSNPQTITRLTSHAIKLIRAASINKDLRNKVSELPNTFCVLILLIRNGVREVLKFVKLIAATMTIRRAIPTIGP